MIAIHCGFTNASHGTVSLQASLVRSTNFLKKLSLISAVRTSPEFFQLSFEIFALPIAQYTIVYAMFLPAFYWISPVYREPCWFETLISDFLGWSSHEISRIVNKSDVLMRLLNHPCWKFVDLFPIFIFMSILFFIFDFWKTRCDQGAEEIVYELPGDTSERRSQNLPSTFRATAANTTPQPERLVERPQSIPDRRIPGVLSPEDRENVLFDAGRYSPVPQTPLTGSSSSSGLSTSPSPRNVSDIKHADPVSYYTLQKGMRLVEDWKPAKKDGEHEYEVATLYDPPTKSYATFRRRKNVGK